jgi:hypothetical protein
MKPEEISALAEKAKQIAADRERLRREHNALIKKIAEFSKEEIARRKQSKATLGASAGLVGPALHPPNPPEAASS